MQKDSIKRSPIDQLSQSIESKRKEMDSLTINEELPTNVTQNTSEMDTIKQLVNELISRIVDQSVANEIFPFTRSEKILESKTSSTIYRSDHSEDSSSDIEIIGEKYIDLHDISDTSFDDQKMNKSFSDHFDSNLSENNERSELFIQPDSFILKMKYVPFKTTIEDIEKFFDGYRYKRNGIHIHKIEGNSIGEVFIEFDCEADLIKALDKNHTRINTCDRKVIEIFRADALEMQICLDDNKLDLLETTEFIKIQGIPFECTSKDIREFFRSRGCIEIANDGIIISPAFKYRTTRDCYIQFLSISDAQKALLLDNEPLGTRYVKIFKSSKNQWKNQASLMLNKSNMPNNYAPKIRCQNKKSIHKVGLYNNNEHKTTRSSIAIADHPNFRYQNTNLMNGRVRANHYGNSESEQFITHSLHRSKGINTMSTKKRKPFPRSYSPDRSIHYEANKRKSHDQDYYDDKRSISSSRSCSSHKRTKISNGFYFKSFYNDDEQLDNDSSEHLKMVKVKNLPKNCSKEELCNFFQQIDLIPKHIKIYVDRARKLTEADVEFHTFEDAKKSFLLSGACLRNSYASRNVDVITHSDLKRVNVINPSNNHFNIVPSVQNSQYYRLQTNHMYQPVKQPEYNSNITSNVRHFVNRQNYHQNSAFSNLLTTSYNENLDVNPFRNHIMSYGNVALPALQNTNSVNQLKVSIPQEMNSNGLVLKTPIHYQKPVYCTPLHYPTTDYRYGQSNAHLSSRKRTTDFD